METLSLLRIFVVLALFARPIYSVDPCSIIPTLINPSNGETVSIAATDSGWWTQVVGYSVLAGATCTTSVEIAVYFYGGTGTTNILQPTGTGTATVTCTGVASNSIQLPQSNRLVLAAIYWNEILDEATDIAYIQIVAATGGEGSTTPAATSTGTDTSTNNPPNGTNSPETTSASEPLSTETSSPSSTGSSSGGGGSSLSTADIVGIALAAVSAVGTIIAVALGWAPAKKACLDLRATRRRSVAR